MYLTKEIKRIPEGYVQSFQNLPSDNPSINERRLVESYFKGVITNADIDILYFFWQFGICTLEQIAKKFKYTDLTKLETKLDKFVISRLLNKFILVDEESKMLHPKDAGDDAMKFYCFDFGSSLLLKHFRPDEDYENWRIDFVELESSRVEKRLMTVDFFLYLEENCGPRLKYLQLEPLVFVNRIRINPKAIFCVEHNGKTLNFVFENFTEDDLRFNGTRVGKKFDRLQSLVCTNGWKKIFRSEELPILILCTDTDESMKHLGELAIECGFDKDSGFRLVSREGLNRDFTKAFKKYKKEDDGLTEKMTTVKIKAFQPE